MGKTADPAALEDRVRELEQAVARLSAPRLSTMCVSSDGWGAGARGVPVPFDAHQFRDALRTPLLYVRVTHGRRYMTAVRFDRPYRIYQGLGRPDEWRYYGAWVHGCVNPSTFNTADDVLALFFTNNSFWRSYPEADGLVDPSLPEWPGDWRAGAAPAADHATTARKLADMAKALPASPLFERLHQAIDRYRKAPTAG